jgi:hypothetical protein
LLGARALALEADGERQQYAMQEVPGLLAHPLSRSQLERLVDAIT